MPHETPPRRAARDDSDNRWKHGDDDTFATITTSTASRRRARGSDKAAVLGEGGGGRQWRCDSDLIAAVADAVGIDAARSASSRDRNGRGHDDEYGYGRGPGSFGSFSSFGFDGRLPLPGVGGIADLNAGLGGDDDDDHERMVEIACDALVTVEVCGARATAPAALVFRMEAGGSGTGSGGTLAEFATGKPGRGGGDGGDNGGRGRGSGRGGGGSPWRPPPSRQAPSASPPSAFASSFATAAAVAARGHVVDGGAALGLIQDYMHPHIREDSVGVGVHEPEEEKVPSHDESTDVPMEKKQARLKPEPKPRSPVKTSGCFGAAAAAAAAAARSRRRQQQQQRTGGLGKKKSPTDTIDAHCRAIREAVAALSTVAARREAMRRVFRDLAGFDSGEGVP